MLWNRHKGKVYLLLAAVLWGLSFVFASKGLERIGVWTYNSIRSLIAALTLGLFLGLRDARGSARSACACRGKAVWGGILCGAALFVASSLQMAGLKQVSIGKTGFMTTCYILFVPLLGLLLGKRYPAHVWLGVAFSALGLYLLCASGQMRMGFGEAVLLLSSVMFAAHFLIVDHYAGRMDGIGLSCVQFATVFILSGIGMLLFDRPSLQDIYRAAIPLLYGGVFSCSLAHTFQILGQRSTNPAVASILCSLEAVFSVIFGWTLMHQRMSGRELAGCAVLFLSILYIEIVSTRGRDCER